MPASALPTLPPELLALILSFLPDLQPTPTPAVIGPNTLLTPPITRTSRALRAEALPLYAASRPFVLATDDQDRLDAWLDALGPDALAKVRSLQLSRHWALARPERGEGHVGFYVSLKVAAPGGGWRCATGTYPIVDDTRGMRLESAVVLREVVGRRLAGRRLRRGDVEFVVRAMEIVARHPVEAFDLEQTQQGRQGRRGAFERMGRELRRLEGEAGGEGEEVDEGAQSAFFTPY